MLPLGMNPSFRAPLPDAMNELDAFIDQALLNNMARVRHHSWYPEQRSSVRPHKYLETNMSKSLAMLHKMLETVAQLIVTSKRIEREEDSLFLKRGDEKVKEFSSNILTIANFSCRIIK